MLKENIFTDAALRSVMTYGQRLEQAQKLAKKSRKDLAKVLGCTVQAIGIVITGAGKLERSLSVVNHAKAARYLKVDSYWLATGDGSPDAITGNSAHLSRMALDLALAFDEELITPKERSHAYIKMMAVVTSAVDARAAPPTVAPAQHHKTQAE